MLHATGLIARLASCHERAGVDGFLGFRFTNADTGQLNYGYARMTTTGTIGFPMTIVSYAFNSAGGSITIPEPPGDDLFADRFEE
ncbi:MAG: hypothetical protein ACXIUL_06590 [Wenzhouxiangella sp.]